MAVDPSRVVIAADQARLHEIREALGFDVVVVAEADDAAEAYVLATTTFPDVVVVDHSLDHADDLIDGVHALEPVVASVFVSTFDEERAFEAIGRGAIGTVFDLTEIGAATDLAAVGAATLTPGVAERLANELRHRSRPRHDLDPPRPSLTKVEEELLCELALGESAESIARRRDVTAALVADHLGHAVAKLQSYTARPQHPADTEA